MLENVECRRSRRRARGQNGAITKTNMKPITTHTATAPSTIVMTTRSVRRSVAIIRCFIELKLSQPAAIKRAAQNANGWRRARGVGAGGLLGRGAIRPSPQSEKRHIRSEVGYRLPHTIV
jgi:hypothetical protein